MLLSSSVLWAADGVISRSPDASGQSCHLKFPAIRENTLHFDRPQLKDPSEGDIIDFYGPVITTRREKRRSCASAKTTGATATALTAKLIEMRIGANPRRRQLTRIRGTIATSRRAKYQSGISNTTLPNCFAASR